MKAESLLSSNMSRNFINWKLKAFALRLLFLKERKSMPGLVSSLKVPLKVSQHLHPLSK